MVTNTITKAVSFQSLVPLLAQGTPEQNAAMIAATLDRDGIAYLPSGDYPCELSRAGGGVIIGHGTNLLHRDGSYAIEMDLAGLAGAVHNISTIIDRPVIVGSDNYVTILKLTTVAEAGGYARGDGVYVGSSDQRPYYTGDTSCVGLTARVAKVDLVQGWVYLSASESLAHLAATNPTIRKLSKEDVSISGIKTVKSGVAGGAPVRAAIRIYAADRPHLDHIYMDDAWTGGVNFTSCLDAEISDSHLHSSGVDPNDGRFGYGISFEGACGRPRAVNCHGSGWRHFITTNTAKRAAFDAAEWWVFGDTTYGRAQNCHAVDCQTAFDTHASSLGFAFENCSAIASHENPDVGDTAASRGFNLRGYADRMVNCSARGVVIGATVMTCYHEFEDYGAAYSAEDDAGAAVLTGAIANECTIDGLDYWSPAIDNENAYAVTVAGNPAVTGAAEANVRLRNIRPHGGARGLWVYSVGNVANSYTGEIAISDCDFANFADWFARITYADCKIRFMGGVVDGRGRRTSSERFIRLDNSSTANIVLMGLNIILGTSETQDFVEVTTGCTGTVYHAGVLQDTSEGATAIALIGGAGTTTLTAM